jgi:lysine N6-hydroxylase
VSTSDILDAVAVGAGPSNLSLAALAGPIPGLKLAVLERRPRFDWHPGMMLFEAAVQTSPVKDLVTLVDPTNRYSFLNFLSLHKRLYRHVIASRGCVYRWEFEQYFRWVAENVGCVRFGAHVNRVDHDNAAFRVHTASGVVRARNVVLGTGRVPYVPEFATSLLGGDVFHSSEYASRGGRRCAGRVVLLVGGGQSAAEIALHLLSDIAHLPSKLVWVSGRSGFLPMDDSPFSNEWFNPQYLRYFHTLGPARRADLLSRQVLASDGVSQALLLAIYQRLYALDYLGPSNFEHALHSGCRLVDLSSQDERFKGVVHAPDQGEHFEASADIVMLATGYRDVLPTCLDPLESRLVLGEGGYRIHQDYSLEWRGPATHRIFVQGGARQTHGIADPNLSLLSFRSASILNRIADRPVYAVDDEHITLALRACAAPGWLVRPERPTAAGGVCAY